MPSARSFVLVLLTMAVAGLAIGHFAGNLSDVRPVLSRELPEPRPQPSGKRLWRGIGGPPALVLAAGGGALLGNPVAVKTGADGSIFVLDFLDQRVERFSPSGAFLRSYGGFRNATDLCLTGGPALWVCDPMQRQISRFDLGTGEVRSLKLPGATYRLAADAAGVITLFASPGERLFTRVRMAEPAALEGFGRLLEGREQNPLATDGWIAGDGAGGLVYAPGRAGLLAAFSAAGDLRFLVETIDPAPLPVILQNKSGLQRVDPRAPVAALSLSVADGAIYVLSKGGGRKGQAVALDVYDLRDGAYRHTFRLARPARAVHVAGGNLYTVGKAEVARWDLPSVPAAAPAAN